MTKSPSKLAKLLDRLEKFYGNPTKTAPVAAVPSNCVHVPLRLGFGEEKKSFAASYRSAQEAIRA